MAEHARQVGEELKDQNGAQGAAIEMESFWKDHVVTGRFWELFLGEEPSSRRSFLPLALAIGSLAAIGGFLAVKTL
jgi:hypothetical protein